MSAAALPPRQVRLIHTSDLHLGDPAGHPGAEAALAAVVDSVTRLGGDALLLAGDIFDNERVGEAALTQFVAEMARLPVPAVLLPGNHDLAHETSVYRRPPFAAKPANLHLLLHPDGETLRFPALGLELWGRAMQQHTPEFRPLRGMPPPSPGCWLVAMAHGHFHMEDERDARSSPIHPPEVAAAPCHYLALGHWDRHADVSRGGVTAVYSGCPREPIGGGPGAVTVVDLDPAAGVSYHQAPLPAPGRPLTP